MSTCPKCGKDNKCAMDNGLPPHTCWCVYREFPEDLLIETNNECVCEQCLDKFIEEQEIQNEA